MSRVRLTLNSTPPRANLTHEPELRCIACPSGTLFLEFRKQRSEVLGGLRDDSEAFCSYFGQGGFPDWDQIRTLLDPQPR